MNPPSAEEAVLFARAAAWESCAELRDLAGGALAEIARQHGLDFATALLYDRVLRHPEHDAFFRLTTEKQESAATRAALVGIVPGAFFREHQNTGADGARVATIVESLNCRRECVPVQSFGSRAANAALIADWLQQHAHERVVLVSLSKGTADVKAALALPNAPDLFRNVVCWVSLSGLSQGTPLVAWLRPQRLRKLGVQLWLWWHGYRYSTVEELRHETDGPLAKWPALPPHLRVIHVVGFPLRRHLAHPWASRAYERLAALGPNDGGGFLLADVTELPGVVFPVWGADHYLEPAWDVAPMFRRLLAEAVSSTGA